jgi:metabolite-proton symporter
MTNPIRRILFASLIGSAIEFFDFYTYANAAVLVFPKLFFPASDPTAAVMQSLATFAIAFFARPIGSAFFGHFGDRVGRKATLVASLLTMGVSTVAIGMLPTYADIGILAPVFLALFRFGQGFGLGGEWGGAVLLAIENAPPGKRNWFGMFPQLGAPIGFLLSGGVFLLLSTTLSDTEFASFGWRIPFLASAVLVLVGLYVRLRITETPAFETIKREHHRVRVPLVTTIREHGATLVMGTLMSVVTFQIFYLITVFAQSWAIGSFKLPRTQCLEVQLLTMLLLGAFIPVSAWVADRVGALRTMIVVTAAIVVFGLATGPLLAGGDLAHFSRFLAIGTILMGASYGPLGAVLGNLFPTPVRYTGMSLTFNLAGILGASLSPYIAVWLARTYSLAYVGYYLSLGASITLLAFLWARRVAARDPAQTDQAPTY